MDSIRNLQNAQKICENFKVGDTGILAKQKSQGDTHLKSQELASFSDKNKFKNIFDMAVNQDSGKYKGMALKKFKEHSQQKFTEYLTKLNAKTETFEEQPLFEKIKLAQNLR